MSLSNLVKFLGTRVQYNGGKIPALGTCVDVRKAFGRTDLQIKADADGVCYWVDLEQCNVINNNK